MDIYRFLQFCLLLVVFSTSQAQQLPFVIQIATAKTPSLVNMIVDARSVTNATEFNADNRFTPTNYQLDGQGQLLDINSNNIPAIRGKRGLTGDKVGIFFDNPPTSVPLTCSISSTNGPLVCNSGAFDTFVACRYKKTSTYQLFLAKSTGKLPCQTVTLKTSTAG